MTSRVLGVGGNDRAAISEDCVVALVFFEADAEGVVMDPAAEGEGEPTDEAGIGTLAAGRMEGDAVAPASTSIRAVRSDEGVW